MLFTDSTHIHLRTSITEKVPDGDWIKYALNTYSHIFMKFTLVVSIKIY